MYRNIMNDLVEWYEEGQNKILLLKGAKGVGKTWAMMDFGQGFYKKMFYIDLEKDEEAHILFKQGIKAEKFLAALCIYLEQTYEEEHTLFVFDEAQLYPQVIETIIELKKQCPTLPICIISSTMDLIPYEEECARYIHSLFLFPMSFEEFLIANKAQELCQCIEKQKLEPINQEEIVKIVEYLKLYYIIGGMPMVVSDYIKYRDLNRVDAVLQVVLKKCTEHIRQYVPKGMAYKVNKIWHSIPQQIQKENRKFMYQYVDEKARAREYEGSVRWLEGTGLVRRVSRIKRGIAPLAEQVDEKAFELYHLDHGLLRMMCGVGHNHLTKKNLFEDINGALLAQLVLSELTMNKTVGTLYFWISGATAKADFVFEENGEVVPVDVQSKLQPKAQSMKVFHQRYSNRMAIRISLEPMSFTNSVLNIPLYGLWNF